MYIYIHIYVYVCIYVCMHILMYICMYACMHACMHVCMYVCMYVCMHVCGHACMYVCMHAFMYACMHACMYVSAGWWQSTVDQHKQSRCSVASKILCSYLKVKQLEQCWQTCVEDRGWSLAVCCILLLIATCIAKCLVLAENCAKLLL